uniref:Uncharacterized protein n=1 Tax=Gruberia lanceolata TaxID=1978530 RepID=A0A6C0UAK7_9CILI|nr:hypothetical protein [Gruberia lanceolata]
MIKLRRKKVSIFINLKNFYKLIKKKKLYNKKPLVLFRFFFFYNLIKSNTLYKDYHIFYKKFFFLHSFYNIIFNLRYFFKLKLKSKLKFYNIYLFTFNLRNTFFLHRTYGTRKTRSAGMFIFMRSRRSSNRVYINFLTNILKRRRDLALKTIDICLNRRSNRLVNFLTMYRLLFFKVIGPNLFKLRSVDVDLKKNFSYIKSRAKPRLKRSRLRNKRLLKY